MLKEAMTLNSSNILHSVKPTLQIGEQILPKDFNGVLLIPKNLIANMPKGVLSLSMKESIKTAIKELLIEGVKFIYSASYYVCLIYGMAGIILYFCGWEKFKKAPTIAIGSYLVIKVIGGVICGL